MADPNLFEVCVREAGKELLARTKLRDSWLKLHLVAQAVIIGLTLGIKADLSVGTPGPTYAALAPALSLMFCLFYGVQDDLIAGISRYLASLSCGGNEGNPT
jgi:hypothetical protein